MPRSPFAKLYDRKNALVAAEMLNDQVLPFYEENDVPLLRVLTDRGTEYCGNREAHEYHLYLAVENIDHSRTLAKSRLEKCGSLALCPLCAAVLRDKMPEAGGDRFWPF